MFNEYIKHFEFCTQLVIWLCISLGYLKELNNNIDGGRDKPESNITKWLVLIKHSSQYQWYERTDLCTLLF